MTANRTDPIADGATIALPIKVNDDGSRPAVLGLANGVPGPLDSSGKLPSSQVPASGGSDPTALHAASNLSDVSSAGTSRTNLGLGTAATHPAGDFAQTANNLSDVANAATALSNLGGAAATEAGTRLGVTSFDGSGNPTISYATKIGIAGSSSPTGLPSGTPYERDAGAYTGEEAVIVVDQNGAIVVRKPSTSATPHNSDPAAHPQVLAAAGTAADTKVSTHNSDTTAHPTFVRKGQAYPVHYPPGAPVYPRGSTLGTVASTVNTLFAAPMLPAERDLTVVRIGIEVTVGAASSFIYFLIYLRDAYGRPSTKLYSSYTGAGTGLDGSTTGNKEVTPSGLVIQSGTEWALAVLCQGGAPTVRSTSGPVEGVYGTLTTDYNKNAGWVNVGASGTPPDPFTTAFTTTATCPRAYVVVN